MENSRDLERQRKTETKIQRHVDTGTDRYYIQKTHRRNAVIFPLGPRTDTDIFALT